MTATPVLESSPWAPLRQRVFAWLWVGVLISGMGTWMQTLGAQWLLVDAPNAAAVVALVLAANTLPIMLLALPSGVLADAFDKRWLLSGLLTGSGRGRRSGCPAGSVEHRVTMTDRPLGAVSPRMTENTASVRVSKPASRASASGSTLPRSHGRTTLIPTTS